MSSPIISLLLPTRGRPDLAERFFQSVLDHAQHIENIELILYVDEDDGGSHHLDHPNLNTVRIIGPRVSMGRCNSRCLEAAQGRIIILVNDDVVIQTSGWDERIIALDRSIPDKVYLAYGNDLFKGKKNCAFPILSRRTCELLVEPFPVVYSGAFIDSHLMDIFMRLKHVGHDRICYLSDVIFEHRHYRTGKAEFDETYRNRDRFADDINFLELVEQRRTAAERLRSAIEQTRMPEFSPADPDHAKKTNNFVAHFVFLTKIFLFDSGLDLRYRFFLWYWFIGRKMAMLGLLRPLVKR